MMLPAIKRQNIYEQVVEYLKGYIIENDLQPGDRLPTEAELAARFRVSRQSVREAVKVLESMGLVETRPRDGSRLKEVSTSSLTDHLHFMFAREGATFAEMAVTRGVIECAFLPAIVQSMDESDVERMEAAIAQMRASVGNRESFIRADMQFHQALVAATKNRVMASFGAMLRDFFAKMRNEVDPTPEQQLVSIREHEQIVLALRKRDAKAADKIMRQHFRGYGLPDSVQGAANGNG
jgi:GntR family transcriptional repressor for pyruvate dehydrogenase complex